MSMCRCRGRGNALDMMVFDFVAGAMNHDFGSLERKLRFGFGCESPWEGRAM